jgi:iron(III) transport system substrate-binding protein
VTIAARRPRRGWWVGAALAATGAAALAACGGGREPLVLYSPHGRDLLTLVEGRYEAAHPEVDVRWLDMGSQEVYDRLRSERANPQADVWFGGPDTILARGAAEGLLQPYRPAWAASVPAASRGEGDLYFGLYRTPAVLVWNERAVAAADAPRDWDDLLAPRFAGKVLIRDPLASGTMRTVFGMVLARSLERTGSLDEGLAWLRRLDAQTKEYVQNPALLHEKMVRQEGWVTVWDLTDILLQRRRGAPLAYGFPASGTPVIDDAVGVVAGAAHADAARAFVDWVGSPEAQLMAAREVFRLPARVDLVGGGGEAAGTAAVAAPGAGAVGSGNGVASGADPAGLPEWVRDVESRLRPAALDWELLARESPEWMRRWDREVRGRGKAAGDAAGGAGAGAGATGSPPG